MNKHILKNLAKTITLFSCLLAMGQTANAATDYPMTGKWKLSDSSPLCRGNYSQVSEFSVLDINSDSHGLEPKIFKTDSSTSWRVPDYAAIVRDVVQHGFSNLRLTGEYTNNNKSFTRLMYEPSHAADPKDGLVYELDALDRLLIYRPIETPKFRDICFFERV